MPDAGTTPAVPLRLWGQYTCRHSGFAVDSRGNIYTTGNGLVQEYVAPPTQG
jgi:hypothetical protein